ncbi:DUF2062 domain-containing protein [Kordiimonas aestuarii]|uniref:DUF2062 domain-containing protein n=1 Tax=Kordiimonas aestuarii TaxID=1005925 RepID=UPI0021D1487B|nr:DUF2062 domain-containing protein [Kordiimonas aestuarii]
MLFRRRDAVSAWKTVSGWLWPRSGWSRAGQYLWHRIARLPGTTHSIAAGVASGVAVSFTPFLGLHFLMGFALAWLTRGNLLASAIGTAIGNPWTFPFIFALTGQLGAVILGHSIAADIPTWSWEALFDSPLVYVSSFLPVVFPLIVGGMPVAIVVWLLFYFSFRALLSGYRAARQLRLQEKKSRKDPI